MGYSKQSAVRKAIDHFGWENVFHEIVASNITMEEATNFERLLIEKLNLMDRRFGYNLTTGGEMVPGCRYSEETRRKQGAMRRIAFVGKHNPHAKPVLCVETGEVFPTGRDAAKQKGVCTSAISLVCSGTRQTAGGFHWCLYLSKEQGENL